MSKFLVLQSDFGLDDGAVAAMYGVAYSVSSDIKVHDLTHGIQPFNIREASYRLFQAVSYWPKRTTFVSIVDPGVGSDRQSIAVKLNTGQFVVTPDNGTLTHLNHYIGIQSVREIDEERHRLPYSQDSHTFHGRDIYVYNGAKLASQETYYNHLDSGISKEDIILLDLVSAQNPTPNTLQGIIEVLDVRFGSLWTNIPLSMVREAGFEEGHNLKVTIHHVDQLIYEGKMILGRSFSTVNKGESVAYINSVKHLAIGINQGNFAKSNNISSGKDWRLTVERIK